MSPTPVGNTPELSVVLPAHNEIALLGSTVTNLLTGLEARKIPFEILIIENGSSDGTLRLGRLLAAQLPEVRILTLATGDYGAALAAGFRAARGRLVANFDVDYYDLAFLDTALQLIDIEGLDIVLASKRAPGASDRRPPTRRLLTAGFSLLLRSVIGLKVSDAHGMKVLNRERLAPIVEECVMRKSLFDIEMVLRAGTAGRSVREVPAVVVERRPPRSSVAWRAIESLIGMIHLRQVLKREAGGSKPPLRRSSRASAWRSSLQFRRRSD